MLRLGQRVPVRNDFGYGLDAVSAVLDSDLVAIRFGLIQFGLGGSRFDSVVIRFHLCRSKFDLVAIRFVLIPFGLGRFDSIRFGSLTALTQTNGEMPHA